MLRKSARKQQVKLSVQRLMGPQLKSLGMTWMLRTGIWMKRATVEG